MLIAHLPAGYLVTKAFIKHIGVDGPNNVKHLWVLGLAFSVIPDIDLVYFYIVDSNVHHHKLIPHLPFFWIGVFLLVFSLAFFLKRKTLYYAGLLCSLNILVHLLLDSFVGFIWWFYPIIDKPYYLFLVPNNFNHWIINFVLHWSFILELTIVCAALYIYAKKD